MGVDFHAYPQAMPALVGGDLVVDLGFSGQTGTGPVRLGGYGAWFGRID